MFHVNLPGCRLATSLENQFFGWVPVFPDSLEEDSAKHRKKRFPFGEDSHSLFLFGLKPPPRYYPAQLIMITGDCLCGFGS